MIAEAEGKPYNPYVYSFTLSCKSEQQFLEINQSVTISHYLWTFNADEIVAWKQTRLHASTDTKTNSDWWYFLWNDQIAFQNLLAELTRLNSPLGPLA